MISFAKKTFGRGVLYFFVLDDIQRLAVESVAISVDKRECGSFDSHGLLQLQAFQLFVNILCSPISKQG